MMDAQEWYDEELALARSILRNLSNEELEKAARDALEEGRYHMLRLGEEESPRWLYMFLNAAASERVNSTRGDPLSSLIVLP